MIRQSSNDRVPGKWYLNLTFTIPATSMPWITLQSVDLRASRADSAAESQPKTIAVSYCCARFSSLLRSLDVQAQARNWRGRYTPVVRPRSSNRDCNVLMCSSKGGDLRNVLKSSKKGLLFRTARLVAGHILQGTIRTDLAPSTSDATSTSLR